MPMVIMVVLTVAVGIGYIHSEKDSVGSSFYSD